MGEQDVPGGASPFDAIRHTTDAGGEYWSARELGPLLGYQRSYRNFQPVIAKAETACEGSGSAVSDHFAHVRTMVALGSGAQREVDDVHLSRYACYLIVQNGDPEKPVIAAGQTYFAVQTRRAELAEADALAGLSDAQRRIYTRHELAQQNRELAATAQGAGVLTPRDFAVFQDHGYRGLYAGETARDIAARKGLASGEPILDWMGSEELAANLFRSTQAEAKLRREGITGKDAANRAHHDVGAAVRRFITDELGGTPPEELPTPAEGIRQLEARERKRIEEAQDREARPSLFPELDTRGKDHSGPEGNGKGEG
jgi:DNA-damage-inducible protein D